MFILDTNVLSELIKRRPKPLFINQLRSYPSEALYTSIICVMELRYGSSRRPDQESFWERIQHEILSRVTILGLGLDEALRAGDLLVHLSRRRELIGLEDLLIGVTALAHDYTVVTANIRHFRRIPNLRVENWLA